MTKTLNKKDLAEAIEEGVGNAIWKPILYAVLIAVGIILFVFIVFYISSGIGNLIQYGEWSHQEIKQAVPRVVCNYPYISCKILELGDHYNCTKSYRESWVDVSCKMAKIYAQIEQKEICGYTEANQWYEQFKNNYDGNKSALKMECN